MWFYKIIVLIGLPIYIHHSDAIRCLDAAEWTGRDDLINLTTTSFLPCSNLISLCFPKRLTESLWSVPPFHSIHRKQHHHVKQSQSFTSSGSVSAPHWHKSPSTRSLWSFTAALLTSIFLFILRSGFQLQKREFVVAEPRLSTAQLWFVPAFPVLPGSVAYWWAWAKTQVTGFSGYMMLGSVFLLLSLRFFT